MEHRMTKTANGRWNGQGVMQTSFCSVLGSTGWLWTGWRWWGTRPVRASTTTSSPSVWSPPRSSATPTRSSCPGPATTTTRCPWFTSRECDIILQKICNWNGLFDAVTRASTTPRCCMRAITGAELRNPRVRPMFTSGAGRCPRQQRETTSRECYHCQNDFILNLKMILKEKPTCCNSPKSMKWFKVD